MPEELYRQNVPVESTVGRQGWVGEGNLSWALKDVLILNRQRGRDRILEGGRGVMSAKGKEAGV